MTNLLPLDAGKKVWGMYRSRFIIALSLLLIALAVFAAIALVPSYLAIELAAPPVADLSLASDRKAPEDPVSISRSQALIRALQPIVAKTTSPTVVIASALSYRPQGMQIAHIVYVGGTPAQLSLSGNASRELISAYGDALKKDPRFQNVSVPVGSLVSADGNFTITITGTF
ncbi:MAG: hypothetical protein WC050_00875 [Candidatus Paceibacterota bacterium]